MGCVPIFNFQSWSFDPDTVILNLTYQGRLNEVTV